MWLCGAGRLARPARAAAESTRKSALNGQSSMAAAHKATLSTRQQQRTNINGGFPPTVNSLPMGMGLQLRAARQPVGQPTGAWRLACSGQADIPRAGRLLSLGLAICIGLAVVGRTGTRPNQLAGAAAD